MTHAPGNGYGPAPWQVQPPRRKNRRTAKVCLAIIAGCFVVLVAVAVSAGGNSPQTSAAAPMGTASPDATHKAAKAKPKGVVTFVVTGRAPAGVDVMYGTDTDNRQGGKGTPMRRTLHLDKKAMYYMLSAQLQGSGDIRCKILLDGKVKATGHASGTYNICSAQWNGGLLGF